MSNRTPAEIAAYLRMMAKRQRELALEFDQRAEDFDERTEPDKGHTWRVTVEVRGSSKVVGDDYHQDEPEFSELPRTVEVRGWDLGTAIAKASCLPLSSWFPEEARVGNDA